MATRFGVWVIDAECLDLDEHVARLGFGLRNVSVDEIVQTAEFFENDGTHNGFSDLTGNAPLAAWGPCRCS
jgi:hypothetical protein